MIARARAIAKHLASALALGACAGSARSADTIVVASGTDLEGMQPLTTVHSLSRQVQRYLVFTPLVRLSSALAPEPWAASSWTWSAGRTQLAFVVDTSLRWHDGAAFTAADARFTIALARDSATGYSRRGDLAAIDSIRVSEPVTLRLFFARPQAEVPMVLAELPIVPEHLLRGVPPHALRKDPFTFAPVGSGPYRVASREAGRRWIFERVPSFPARLGGVAATRTLVIAVIDEATTKVAGLVSGALDIAGESFHRRAGAARPNASCARLSDVLHQLARVQSGVRGGSRCPCASCHRAVGRSLARGAGWRGRIRGA